MNVNIVRENISELGAQEMPHKHKNVKNELKIG